MIGTVRVLLLPVPVQLPPFRSKWTLTVVGVTELMVIVTDVVVVCEVGVGVVAVMIKLVAVSATAGVPEITPVVAFIVKPAGNVGAIV